MTLFLQDSWKIASRLQNREVKIREKSRRQNMLKPRCVNLLSQRWAVTNVKKNFHRKLAAKRKSCEFWVHWSPFTCVHPTLKTSRKILQKCVFPILLLTLSMPHARGRLKTQSQRQLCLVWSFLHGELRQKPPKLQYESTTPQPFYSLVFLESGGWGWRTLGPQQPFWLGILKKLS